MRSPPAAVDARARKNGGMASVPIAEGVVRFIDPLSDTRWAELVRTAPGALAFHHPLWLQLVASEARCTVGACAVPASDRTLAAGIPFAVVRNRLAGTRIVALPYSTSCPLLVAPGADVDRAGFADAMRNLGIRLGGDVEVRTGFPADHGAYVSQRFIGHRLALDAGLSAVMRGVSRGHRSGIAKAVREGVTVEHRTDAEALRRFYRLHVATRRRLGLPTPRKRFILRFADLFAEGLGFVTLARQHGRDTAAAVFFTTGGTVFYEAGASDVRFLSARPNNLVFSEAIRWACENAHHTFDFGRTDVDNLGLARFKSSWGAAVTTLVYCRYGDAPEPSRGLARKAVSATISRAPPSFGRLIGAAYYRYSG